MIKVLAAFLLLSGLAFAQGTRIGDDRPVQSLVQDSRLVTSAGVTPQFVTAPGAATINLCSRPANAVPCTNKATTYTDVTVATPCSTSTQVVLAGTTTCVGASDSGGNWGAWVKAGNYDFTITIQGLSFGPFTIGAGAVPSGIGTFVETNPTATQTITGQPLILTGNLVPKLIDNVQVVDSTLSRGGADICAEINLAYTALPASGGTIQYYPTASGNPYSCTTPIVFTTSGKLVNLVNMGTCTISTGSVTGGGCINFTPTTAVTALTADYVALTNSAGSAAHGLSNVVIINNGCITTAGCASSAIGLSNGTTNQGMLQGQCFNCGFIGFGVGYQDLNDKAVDIIFTNPQFQANTVAMKLSSPTGIYLNGGTINGNGTAIQSSAAGATPAIDIQGTQFFGNPSAIFDFTASTSPGLLNCINCHLENGSANNANAHYLNGVIDATFTGGVAEDDSSVGTGDWMFNTGGNVLTIQGMIFKCVRTCTSIVTANNPTRGILRGMIGSAGHFTNNVNGANAGKFTVEMLSGPSNIAAIAFSYESLFSPTIEVGTGSGLIIDEDGAPSGTATKDTCYGSSAAPHGIRCDYNLDGSGFGSVPTINRAWTWTGVQSFASGTFLPSAAGGTDIGSTALPFGNLWLGTAATNNFKFQPVVTAAARIIEVMDSDFALGKSMVTSTYTNATTTASNITGLSFAVLANRNYMMDCQIYYQGSAATAGLDITLTGPAAATSIFYSYEEDATATSAQNSVASAFGTKLVGNATVTATTNLIAHVTMGLRNAANAGTVQVQGSATGAGTVTVQAGSACNIQ